MYSNNNINILLKSKSVLHNLNKSHIENVDLKLNTLSKNIDKLKKKVLHMNLDEELISIKSNIDNLYSCIRKVNDEAIKNINLNDSITGQLKEMKTNVDSFNRSYNIANSCNVTHADLELINNNLSNLKLLIDYIIEKNNSDKIEIGNCFLYELITTIEPGNYNNQDTIDYDLKILDGSSIQPINVYKIGYYSSDLLSSQPIKLYGTLLVPNNIIKEEIISYKNDIIYELQSNNSIWKAVGPDGIWNLATTQDKSLLANENLLKINCLLSLSSLGYIVIIPDGFNTSNTLRIFTYEGETIPSVDMIKSIRKLILYSPSIFNGFELNDQPLNVIQLGYSSGGIYGPSIINEFYYNSSKINKAEINFVAGHFGGVPSIETIINNLFTFGSNKDKGCYRLPIEMLILFALYFGNCPIIEQIAQPSAYGNFFQLFKGKWFQDWNKFSKQVFINLVYNHELNVLAGIHNNKDDTVEPYIKPNENMFDIRQIINIQKFVTYKEYFLSQSGWSNILRPLENLKNIPISNMYSETDELSLLKLYQIDKSCITIDCSEYLDKYMSKGESLLDGPNKKIIISSNSNNEYIYETIKQYDMTNLDDIANIIGDIKYMNNNEYRRYILGTSKLNKELHGHNKFIFIWFNILYHILI